MLIALILLNGKTVDLGFVPVFNLKPGVKAVGGDGKTTPYTLSK